MRFDMYYRKRLERIGAFLLLAGLFLVATGCDLDITNPNNASEEQVLTTPEGIKALAVGMQEFYAATTLETMILTPGITSREVAINTTFANLIELEDGGTALPNTNGNVLQVWSRNYRVVGMAEQLIANTPNVNLDPGTRSGIEALARLHKAMALGNLALSFEQAMLNTTLDGTAPFVSRQEVFAEAIRLLGEALGLLDATPVSSEFNSEVKGSGLDLRNTINAYGARYNLFAGNYQAAISAANAVDASATSTFVYSDQSQNPIYNAVIVAEDYAPRDLFGLMATNADDARLAFYMVADTLVSTPNGYAINDIAGFFTTAASPIPMYLPGELALIRAEAHVRLGNLSDAVAAIDAVRTKTAADDPFGI
ncbi:MAG TPA: hypothetical protein VKP65_06220, partial [Rhodothermales bacterium]|nr:hypothetical protein [Rhodothermales bacterium]